MFKGRFPVGRLALLLGAGVLSSQSAYGQLKAFPEAEGFGAFVTGGRTGSIYHVTNLNDSGAGSLRDAVGTSNRIVVFDVGGVINISSQLVFANNITLAGQTAPGGGITVYGDGVSLSNRSNVIVRNIRFRQGIDSGDGVKALNITTGNNMIFDHVSVEWGRWDTIGMTAGTHTVTFQNSIIGEAIDPQQFGGLIDGSDNITLSHNLFINNDSRNPKAKGTIQYINNVVYNWGGTGLVGGHSSANHYLDVINNYFIKGPSSNDKLAGQFTATDHVYFSGNLKDMNKNGVLDGVPVVAADFTDSDGSPTLSATSYFKPAAPVTVDSAAEAYAKVVAGAGASLARDAVDTRLISQVTSLGTSGALVAREGDVGGQPAQPLATRPAEYDTDNDGIPNAWETAHGLNPSSATDARKLNPLGYLMLEQYFNEIGSNRAARTWKSSSGEWNTAGNWTAALPTTTDEAYITGNGAGTTGQVNLTAGNAACYSLHIGGNSAAAGEKVAVSGGNLTIYDTLYVGEQNKATLEITGGTVSAWNVQLGNTVSGATHTGTLNLNTGGTLAASQLVRGGGTLGSWTTGSAFNWNGGTFKAMGDARISIPATLGAAGGWVDTSGASCTISGVISGSGALSKTGTGTLTLTTANSYQGGTVVLADTLAPKGAAGADVIPGPVTLGNGSNVVWLKPGAADQFANGVVITWNNGAKDAKFQLSGSSQAVAGLQSSTNQSLAIIQNAEQETPGAATLTLNGTGTYSFHGIIRDKSSGTAGALSLVKTGAGTQTLINRANLVGIIYTGTTTVQGGTLIMNFSGATAGNFASDITNHATLGLDGAWTLNKTISGAGEVLKQGPGVVTLAAVNPFTGDTRIQAGTLALAAGGSIASSRSIDVSSGATFNVTAKNAGGGYALGSAQTLKGRGTVAGNMIAVAGSHLAPGQSVGTLTFSGNLTLQKGVILDFELAGPAGSDKIAMPGSALGLGNLEFSDFRFTALPGFGVGTYTLVDAGSLTGALGSSRTGVIGGFSAALSTLNNDLILTVVPLPEPASLIMLGLGTLGLGGRRRWASRA